MSFLNVDIKTNSKPIENFNVQEPLFRGGAFKTLVNGSITEKYIQFNSSGTLTISNSITCDIFMIGGGGGGGYNHGGGGGAGAYYNGSITLNSGTYNINIGSGGNGGSGGSAPQNGGDTFISSNSIDLTINGNKVRCKGGGGAGMYNANGFVGNNGGCGGGADGWSGNIGTNSVIVGGSTNNTGTIGTGFNGGSGRQFYNSQELAGGGGGGIGSVGGNATGKEGGNGGNALVINITGSEQVFGGGGGGGEWPAHTNAPGGIGGSVKLKNGTIVKVGGDAVRNEGGNGGDAIINTGSGGGGGKAGRGGNGSSGVVIIRYRSNIIGDILDYPIVWYKFDSFSTLLNDSMNINNNLINNGTTFDNTNFIKGDGSLKFIASSSQYALIPNIFNWNIINVSNGISFSWWAKNNSSSGTWARLLDFGNKSSPDTCCGSRYILVAKSGNSTNLGFYISNPAEYNYGYTNQLGHTTQGINYFDGIWRHYVWTISSTGIWNIYINNSKILDNVQKNVIAQMSGTIYNYLGKSLYNNDGYYDGNLDDFRIYNYVLTPNQINNLYFDQEAYNISDNNKQTKNLSVNKQFNSNNEALNYISQYDSSINIETQNIIFFAKNPNSMENHSSTFPTIFPPNRYQNGIFKSNDGEIFLIVFKDPFILKKITFVAGNDIKTAPASFDIYYIENKEPFLIKNIIATREDYNEFEGKSQNTCIKFLIDNNINADKYLIVFKSVLGGTELKFNKIILYTGTKPGTKTTALSSIDPNMRS